MIKDKLYICFFLISFFLYGCHNTHTEKNMLAESVLSDAKLLKLDTIDLSGIDTPLAYQYYVYKDSILIVQNRSRDGHCLIELYELKSKKLKNKLLRIGRGRNEVLQCTSFVSGNKLTVYDFQLHNLFCIDIDSALSSKQYIPKGESVRAGGVSGLTYIDNQPIMDNLYVFDDDNLDVHQKGERLLFCKDCKEELGKNYKFNTLNVNSGSLVIASPDHKKVMYASGHLPEIELYNSKLELIKDVYGPNELPVKYYIDDNNEVIFNGSIPYTYINYYCTSHEVGLLYYGTLVDATKDELENHEGWLLVFDWMGNFKRSYSLGAHVRTISNSTKWTNTYYCCVIGKNKNLYLCKAHD